VGDHGMNMYELGETEDQAAVIADALGQIGGDITENLDDCAALITDWKHRADAMATEAKRLSDARTALVVRADRLEACMMQLMESRAALVRRGDRLKACMMQLMESTDSGETVYGATLHRGPTTVTIK